jgi:4-aminobutyrate aminotransferase/(S)-3-amino-2-methylpropionate transaminase
LGALQRAHPDRIGEIRNRGAMIAMELVKNGNPDEPDAELCKAMVAAAQEKGLILLSCGLYGNVIRFLPALTIPDTIMTEGLTLVAECFEELV